MPPPRRELTLKEKISLIEKSENEQLSCRQLAAAFNIGKTQASTILKRKAEYTELYAENGVGERKRKVFKTGNEDINSLMWEWFQKARSVSIPVSGPMLQEKALMFAEQLGKTDFKASNGWLDNFRKRHNITFKVVCGESADVPQETVDSWKERLSSLVR